jgi:hypothetical protein
MNALVTTLNLNTIIEKLKTAFSTPFEAEIDTEINDFEKDGS